MTKIKQSYYLEQLQRKGLELSREQQATRNALKVPYKIPSMKNQATRSRSDLEVERQLKKDPTCKQL